MKNTFRVNWLILYTCRYKATYKSSISQSPCSGFCSKQGNLDFWDVPFTNVSRDSCQTEVDVNANFPLQVKLESRIHENQLRIYRGDKPSVTTILDVTRPKNELYALLNWRRTKIKHLGEDGYNERMKHIKQRGMSFHHAIKQHILNGTKPMVEEPNLGYWRSVQHVLENIDKVVALESVVVHPYLPYAGTLDGLVLYQGKLCVIDWKTSERKRSSLKECFSYPHQIVAYAGAVNFDSNYSPMQVRHGLLVMAYLDGTPADTIWIPPDVCQHYWQEWLCRLKLYNHLVSSHMSTPHSYHRGNKLQTLAKYMGGLQVNKYIWPQENMTELLEMSKENMDSSDNVSMNRQHTDMESTLIDVTSTQMDVCGTNMDVAELSEGVVDILDGDPSTNEFEDICY